jgi:hypothetical protein
VLRSARQQMVLPFRGFLLVPFPSESGLDPTGPWRFVVEIEIPVAPWAAVPGGAADIGRLRGPGERLLFGNEVGELQDDFIHSAWGSGMVGFHS